MAKPVNPDRKVIQGGPGDDTLDGSGPADQTLIGGGGSDTYVFGPGAGHDVVSDFGAAGLDRILFAGAVVPLDVGVSREGNDLVLTLSADQSITVSNYFVLPTPPIQIVEFGDGTIWTTTTLEILSNVAPVLVTPIPNQAATQDAFFRYVVPAGTFTDPDAARGETLVYEATLQGGGALPPWLAFDPVTATFSGTPANEDVGALNVVVTAVDRLAGRGSATFTLSVANVNDAPAALPIAPQAATEDQAWSFSIAGAGLVDPDVGDTLRFTAQRSDGGAWPAWLQFDGVTGTFSGVPANEDVGSLAISVTATDLAGVSATAGFTLTVANSNDAPTVAAAPADQTVAEDSSWSFTVPAGAFADVDVGDRHVLSASGMPGWMSFDDVTGTFTGTPANGDVGGAIIQLTATDGAGAQANASFVVTVANTNDAPVVVMVPPTQSATEGQLWSFVVPEGVFADVDAGDSLTISAGALPAWLSFDAGTSSFSGTPADGDAGNVTLSLIATDRAGETAVAGFVLEIAAPANQAPTVAVPLENQFLAENFAWTYTVPAGTFADSDAGDVITLTAATAHGDPLPEWVAFDADSGTFSGTPGPDEAGTWEFAVTATDAAGASVASTFSVEVGPNHAPYFTQPYFFLPVIRTSVTEETPFTWTLDVDHYFADPDAGDTLTVTVDNQGDPMPEWISFDPLTNTFSGTPDEPADAALTENETLRVRVTDRAGAIAGAALVFNITLVDDAPVVNHVVATQFVDPNEPWSLTFHWNTFNDPDYDQDITGYELTLQDGSPVPGWMNWNPFTLNVAGVPAAEDAGVYTLRLQGLHDAGNEIHQDFQVIVGDPFSGPLRGRDLGYHELSEGVFWSYTLPASAFSGDGTDEALVLSATLVDGRPLPEWLTFDAATRTLSGTPTDDQLRGFVSTEVQVVATNSAGAVATSPITLAVFYVDDAPPFTADTLVGGPGNDTFFVDNALDVVIEAPDGGRDLIVSEVTYTLPDNVEDLMLGGGGDIAGTGNALDNLLYGNEGANVLAGGAGDDWYAVAAGDTVLENPGEGRDVVSSLVSWTLGANQEVLTLRGTAPISGSGNELANLLSGASNSGANVLAGGAGDDEYLLGSGDSVVEFAGEGYDTIHFHGSFVLPDHVEAADALGTGGSPGNHTVVGNALDNRIATGSGHDTLDGGAGNDLLRGNDGSDTYLLRRGGGADTIEDAAATALGDTDVARFLAGVTADQLWFTRSGDDLQVAIIGTADGVTVTDWYLGAEYQVDQFQTADDGKTLHAAQVQALVDAMAAYQAPALGEVTLAGDHAALAPVIAANWA